MKRLWRRVTPFTVLAALMLFGLGCAKNTATPLQGRWVDVNGDTVLEFKGNRMTMRWGEWKEEYRIKYTKTDYGAYIENDGQYEEFGLLSTLTYYAEDNCITGRENVLDAEGHSFRFVREDQKAKELEIVDLSDENAAKTIESREITEFSLNFSNDYGSYGLGRQWPTGRYSWEIERRDDGYFMKFDIMGESYIITRYAEPVTEEYVRGLAEVIEREGIPAQNGYYRKNNTSRHDWWLWVRYASKEKLSLRAEGDAAATCVFSIPNLLDYAAQQPLGVFME